MSKGSVGEKYFAVVNGSTTATLRVVSGAVSIVFEFLDSPYTGRNAPVAIHLRTMPHEQAVDYAKRVVATLMNHKTAREDQLEHEIALLKAENQRLEYALEAAACDHYIDGDTIYRDAQEYRCPVDAAPHLASMLRQWKEQEESEKRAQEEWE